MFKIRSYTLNLHILTSDRLMIPLCTQSPEIFIHVESLSVAEYKWIQNLIWLLWSGSILLSGSPTLMLIGYTNYWRIITIVGGTRFTVLHSSRKDLLHLLLQPNITGNIWWTTENQKNILKWKMFSFSFPSNCTERIETIKFKGFPVLEYIFTIWFSDI